MSWNPAACKSHGKICLKLYIYCIFKVFEKVNQHFMLTIYNLCKWNDCGTWMKLPEITKKKNVCEATIMRCGRCNYKSPYVALMTPVLQPASGLLDLFICVGGCGWLVTCLAYSLTACKCKVPNAAQQFQTLSSSVSFLFYDPPSV